MEQSEFLEKHVFIDLENLNDGYDEALKHYFSETDFETVLERSEYFGIGIYSVEARLSGEPFETSGHEAFKKKATNPAWYKKAFLTLTHRQTGLSYAATYKVSGKLLARYSEPKAED